jgi:3-oxoacyl-[acyl-carrier protein] reductase
MLGQPSFNPLPEQSRPSGTVLVTGASGTIGRGICLAFARAGWHVGVHYRRNKAAAEDVLSAICSIGGAGVLYQADIREPDSVQRMARQYSESPEGPLVLVCNAGIAAGALVVRQRDEQWTDIVATNLSGTFHCVQAMGPVMIGRGGGSIVVVGSHAGSHGTAGQSAYAASKAGLVGLVRSAAWEWGSSNVRINLLLPGWHHSPLSDGAMPEADWTDHALNRPPSLDEVSRTVVYLSQLRDLSGQVWNCDSRYD